MECFTLFRTHLAMSGITEQQMPLNSPLLNFNLKNSAVIVLASLTGSTGIKLFDEAKTFEEYIDMVFILVFTVIFNIIYINVVWKTPELFGLVRRLEDTINKRVVLNLKSQSLYTETSQRIQKWIKIGHFIYLIVIPSLTILPSFLISYYRYFTTDLGNDAFEFLYPMWVPFDTKNPFGFLVATIIIGIEITNVLITVNCFILLGIATLPMLFPLTDDIKRHLNAIQNSIKHKRKRSEMVKPLTQFIQFHSDTRQLARDLSKFWHTILSMLCSVYIVGMCSELLSFEIKMRRDTHDSAEMMNLIYHLFGSFSEIFAICELGERASIAFDEIRIEFEQLKWYLLPHKTRKMLPIILMVVQEPVEFDIFGSISSDRKTFKKICHNVYSSFMTLREIGIDN